MSNFPIGKDHELNLVKILTYAKDAAKKGDFFIAKILYDYLLGENKHKKSFEIDKFNTSKETP